jgi:AcrR family transcriptional regulator
MVRVWPQADVKLTGGPHGMPPQRVREVQRERMLKAMTEVVAREGYAETTVRKLLDQAGLSRRTYYDLWVDKEDCYLDAYGVIAEQIAERAAAGFERGETPRERVRLAVEALAGFCVEQPDAACACIVEGLAAGPGARAKRTELIEAIAATVAPALAELRPDAPNPALTARATVGGILELLYGPLARRDVKALRDLAGQIGELPILLPIGG